MGRPIPRFSEHASENRDPGRRMSVTTTFNPDDLRTMSYPPWIPTYNFNHHQHHNPLVLVHPSGGRPEERLVPMRTNPIYFQERASMAAQHPMYFIPPWGSQANDPGIIYGYAGTVHMTQTNNTTLQYREQRSPVSPGTQAPQASRRMSMVDESYPFPHTESLIVESRSNRESVGSMPEEYREALRLVIANLMRREAEEEDLMMQGFEDEERRSTNGRE